MKGSAAKIQMTSLDALFGGAAAQAAGDQIQEIPLTGNVRERGPIRRSGAGNRPAQAGGRL